MGQWVKAEAEQRLIMSLFETMIILITRSLSLSLIVVAATLVVLGGLVFFVVVLMGWSIGLLEGISVIYFIGYAVTYSLHVAHLYGFDIEQELLPPELSQLSWGSQMRFRHTSLSLKSIGAATLGSGITTAGASFFLIFCQLSVF